MKIPAVWRMHGTRIGWIVFAVLLLPLLVFAMGVGISNRFTIEKVITAAVEFIIVAFTSWLLGYGLSRGSTFLVVIASIFIILILVAYAAAISLLIGGLRIKVF